ncbi:NAD(+) diphosphatase [Sphingomonas oleivorans]|uniref:NAD(+) diphosphatase n=1 Tax=Sphingomonas oleivorans TaxID=1735121 RepID=A0A2T5FXZ1_9SPHN|nr:NAD(+) diphosphatase [Sphingomonas oleivorans]PTQ10999.1 NAD(+) diphosphatase [Sphingomonas oleivorans]
MPLPGFTGSPLDRADHLRGDPEIWAALVRDPAARLLLLDGYDPLTGPEGRLGWGLLNGGVDGRDMALLGLIDGSPRFIEIRSPAPAARRSPALMAMLDSLPEGEAATYAAARSLADWHARHHFCANCGSATAPFRAGWGRHCDACGTDHFPRTDPVVIMLAEYRGRVLVGRQPAFPPGRYSALAGFLEVGESMEEAVARELAEEAGVRVGPVRYVASQPWPFPSSLMLACIAEAESETIRLDENELEDAMWVTREEVAAALGGDPDARFGAPPPYAIANTLFRKWLAGA